MLVLVVWWESVCAAVPPQKTMFVPFSKLYRNNSTIEPDITISVDSARIFLRHILKATIGGVQSYHWVEHVFLRIVSLAM